MIVGGQTEERASTIIDYHWLSWAVWPKLYWQISNSATPETTRVNWDVRAWEMIYCLTFTWDWKMSLFDFISRTIIFSLNHGHFFEFQRHSNFNGVAFRIFEESTKSYSLKQFWIPSARNAVIFTRIRSCLQLKRQCTRYGFCFWYFAGDFAAFRTQCKIFIVFCSAR